MPVQPILPLTCAIGESPPVTLPCAATVNLCPADFSVPTNHVIITGNGTINSFGPSQAWTDSHQDPNDDPVNPVLPNVPVPAVCGVLKRVEFKPSGGNITLHHNPPFLALLGNEDRVISTHCYGNYCCDTQNYWYEESFFDCTIQPTAPRGTVLAVNYYTSSQTITIPKDAHSAKVQMWGGTGATGNGSAPYGYSCYSPGTGAAGYLEKFLTGLTPGNTLIFTRGAAGVVGASPGNNGGASILASGTQTISPTLTANGSNGTTGASGQIYPLAGTPGGTATGGDINITGQSGSGVIGTLVDPINAAGAMTTSIGMGGMTMFSRGADGGYPNGNPGTPGGLIITWYA